MVWIFDLNYNKVKLSLKTKLCFYSISCEMFRIINNEISKIKLEHKRYNINVHFSGTPTDESILEYIKYFKKNRIKTVFCFCELSYSKNILVKYNIDFYQLEIKDGEYPSYDVLNNFDNIINNILSNKKDQNIFIHCKAGLGRAPLMLAYLMMSRYKYSGIRCIEEIRSIRRCAFNQKQLDWIIDFDQNNLICCIIL